MIFQRQKLRHRVVTESVPEHMGGVYAVCLHLLDLLTVLCAKLPVFVLIFIGVKWLYTVMLASTIRQSESAVCVYTSPVFWISFPFRSPLSTG